MRPDLLSKQQCAHLLTHSLRSLTLHWQQGRHTVIRLVSFTLSDDWLFQLPEKQATLLANFKRVGNLFQFLFLAFLFSFHFWLFHYRLIFTVIFVSVSVFVNGICLNPFLRIYLGGLYGHSTVYHNVTRSLYVYGGYEMSTRGAGLSNQLYRLQLVNSYSSVLWNRLQTTDSSQVLVVVVVVVVVVVAAAEAVDGWSISVYNQPPRSTHFSFPPVYVNWVPDCLAGIQVGHVHLCWVAGNTMWFHVAGDTL